MEYPNPAGYDLIRTMKEILRHEKIADFKKARGFRLMVLNQFGTIGSRSGFELEVLKRKSADLGRGSALLLG